MIIIEEGIEVGGRLIKALRFADDQAMIVGSQGDLPAIMNKLDTVSNEHEVKIFIKRQRH